MNFDSTGSLSIYNQSGTGVFLAPNIIELKRTLHIYQIMNWIIF